MSTVIDTNCFKLFQEERVDERQGTYYKVITRAIDREYIAIDDEGKALQEYNDCCRPSAVGLNLCDWIADQIVNKVIVMFKMDRGAEKELRKMGVPSPDLKWPAIALGAKSDTIVTEDIDLFDPKAKKRKAKEKIKIKRDGGCVSKFLRRQYGIDVVCAEEFIA
ncbi:hypothetical protein OHD62_20060 [Mesorhizobium sp. YC-39]|uniref:hypothetical protein n=1 Tax=unclassified Mesorhizobium TaxID=325217 RepID=UPI0021E7FB38|nr:MULTISPECIES: hypothetical protein [unclassified Mesorhizobium]MCV3210141.1 hypothetical protein [Mesorhizobium sp. YC-2]MCV3230671.1 hypothetical protein [Mesorhizobium sp. YC-39]